MRRLIKKYGGIIVMKYFIDSIAFIKENTTIGNNVLDADIQPIIRATVDKHVKPVMGCLFDEYLEKYNTPGAVWSDQEKRVLEIVQLFMIWSVAYEATYAISRPIRGKGAQMVDGEYSTSAEDEAVYSLMKRQLSFKDTYERELINEM